MNIRDLLELRDSIRRRGFWVDIAGEEFILDAWDSKRDFHELVNLLKQLLLTIEKV